MHGYTSTISESIIPDIRGVQKFKKAACKTEVLISQLLDVIATAKSMFSGIIWTDGKDRQICLNTVTSSTRIVIHRRIYIYIYIYIYTWSTFETSHRLFY